jgi:hypothetical protein
MRTAAKRARHELRKQRGGCDVRLLPQETWSAGMSMDYIRRTYGVPAKRGGRIAFTTAEKAAQGTIVGARGQYLRVRMDESAMTHTMHPTWMLVYLETPNVQLGGWVKNERTTWNTN